MKKKFHIVGTLLYVRNFKCGAGVGAAALYRSAGNDPDRFD